WSAQCALASARFSAVLGIGFVMFFAFAGTAIPRAVLATSVSICEGLSRALKPCRIMVSPANAISKTAMRADHSTRAFAFLLAIIFISLASCRRRWADWFLEPADRYLSVELAP